MSEGFFMIPRSVMMEKCFEKKPFCKRGFFSYLCEIAIFKPQYRNFPGGDIWLEKGEIAISLRQLAKIAGWTAPRVSRVLKVFQNRDIIKIKSVTPVTVISICFLSNKSESQEKNDTRDLGKTLQQRYSNVTQPKKGRKKEEKHPCQVADATSRISSFSQFKKPQKNQRPEDEVFEHWKVVMEKPKAIFGARRKRSIRARLYEGRTVEDLKLAINGCKNTSYNMGINDTGQIYNDIELICRSEVHVERYMENSPARPSGTTGVVINMKAQDAAHAKRVAEYTKDLAGRKR